MNETVAHSETEISLYTGALAAAVIGLLPYINVFILPAYVIGATGRSARQRSRLCKATFPSQNEPPFHS